MHEITNTNRQTPRTIPTDGGRVTLAPGEKKKFAVGSLSAGLLRVISHVKSDLKLDNISAEAKELATVALARVKKRGFAIVHGSAELTVEQALARERKLRNPLDVRDEFSPAKAAAKSQANLADVVDRLAGPQDNADTNDDQGDDPLGETETKTERVKLETAVSPIGLLIADAQAGSVSMKDLRARAKELLGDAYPSGQLAKDDIIEALTKAKKKA
jgi:hypothetical protein